MRMIAGVLALATCLPLVAHADVGKHTSPYVGEEKRTIRTLSPADIDELRRGGGWGFAKAAELNGVPGPLHILEMAAEIGLSAGQERAVRALFEDMRREAIPLGERLVEQEAALNALFAKGPPDAEDLRRALTGIGETRSALRYVHLATHLKTPDILTPHQIATYNRLRGYGLQQDRCANPPAGHDAERWRRHNNCG